MSTTAQPLLSANVSGTSVARPWKWTKQRYLAARLLAEGKWTTAEVCAKAGMIERKLFRLKHRPEFMARVQKLADRYAELGDAIAIANRKRRLEKLEVLDAGLERIQEERAADPSMQAVPGGKSGLLTRTRKVVGAGDAAVEVEEYHVDTGLVKERREVLKQAAQEAGQWVQKHAQTSPDGTSEALGMNPAERASRILAILVQAGGPLPAPPQTITVQALPSPTSTLATPP